jgi:hypothetical protein
VIFKERIHLVVAIHEEGFGDDEMRQTMVLFFNPHFFGRDDAPVFPLRWPAATPAPCRAGHRFGLNVPRNSEDSRTSPAWASRGTISIMTQSATKPLTIEDALAALKRDPTHPVRVHVDAVDMDVELRAVATPAPEIPLGDFLAQGGGWQGESHDEILTILREGRKAGGSKEPPRGL